MAKNKQKSNRVHPVVYFVLGIVYFGLVIAYFLRGQNVALFNPKGLIATQQYHLIIYAVQVMMVLAIPTLCLLYFFAWKYRESNDKVAYSPKSHNGFILQLGLWAIPFTFFVILASHMWTATHNLAPQKAIIADVKPLTIQVIAMRWKWLFIYPEQGIASVNYVDFPAQTPIQFELTADDAPMNSFWIPNLSGQLYAMTGHENLLNILADSIGDYTGRAAEINGDGFAGMTFTARASSASDFSYWVQNSKQSTVNLDESVYANLVKPSQNNPITVYASTDSNIFSNVLAKYSDSHQHFGGQL